MKGIMGQEEGKSALDKDLNYAIRRFGEGLYPQAEETC